MIIYDDGSVGYNEQFIITAGDHVHMFRGPFPSEEAAHAEYRRNQPKGMEYLSPPTIVRLLRGNRSGRVVPPGLPVHEALAAQAKEAARCPSCGHTPEEKP